VVVVASAADELRSLLGDFARQKTIIDLVGVWDIREEVSSSEGYDGIAW